MGLCVPLLLVCHFGTGLAKLEAMQKALWEASRLYMIGGMGWRAKIYQHEKIP